MVIYLVWFLLFIRGDIIIFTSIYLFAHVNLNPMNHYDVVKISVQDLF